MSNLNHLRKTYLELANQGVIEWEEMYKEYLHKPAPKGQAKRIMQSVISRVYRDVELVSHPMSLEDHVKAVQVALDIMREEEREAFCETLGAMDFERRAYG